ncbi:hypothetical protein MCL35_12075 [Acinetobacter pittii]|nr:hypothetical protein [Acinetobacter pittii]MCG9496909.1 hypothetical protein [Acinetobacter pittii]SSV86260.1 Uncharacterised protein [Acinetobacter pittii]
MMFDLNKEREAFLNTFQYYKGRRDIIFSHEHELFMTRSNNPSEIAQKEISNMNSRWDAWLRCAKHRDAELEKVKAQAVPETHVLIEKSKISTWWQDADEPENFASTEEQLMGLIAESEIFIDDMLIVEKHVQAQLGTQKLYCVYQITNKETGLAEIKVCESESEAQEILHNNAKWIAEKEADQYESMNAFFEEEERKSGAEQ